MSFPDESFNAQTRSLMTRAFDDAWGELRAMLIAEPIDADGYAQSLPFGSRPQHAMASAIPNS